MYGTTWGLVADNKIIILGRTIPLNWDFFWNPAFFLQFFFKDKVPGRRNDARSVSGWVTHILRYSSLNRIVNKRRERDEQELLIKGYCEAVFKTNKRQIRGNLSNNETRVFCIGGM